jgi:hypothetical protein
VRLPHPIRNMRAERSRIDANYRETLGDRIATLNTRITRDAAALDRWQREGVHPLWLGDVQERLHCDRGQRDEDERQLRRTERRPARRRTR